MPVPDRSGERAMQLHERLRAFLVATMPNEAPDAIIGALMYEAVSIVASASESEAQAREFLTATFQAAREQITGFGVGRPHP